MENHKCHLARGDPKSEAHPVLQGEMMHYSNCEVHKESLLSTSCSLVRLLVPGQNGSSLARLIKVKREHFTLVPVTHSMNTGLKKGNRK